MVSLYKILVLVAAVACVTVWGAEREPSWVRGVGGRSDPNSCTKNRGPCHFTVGIENGQSFFNLSCDCSYGDWSAEMSSTSLEQLANLPCQGKPVNDNILVNVTAISIKACKMQDAFPHKLVGVLRRSEHLDISIKDSPRFRMTQHSVSTHIVPKITATISNSEVSGLVSGWFTGTKDLDLRVVDSTVDVVDSKALLGFPPGAVTNILITNSTLKTIKMYAIELPAESTFTMDNCKVYAWDDSAYLGGRALVLTNLRVGRMLRNAINIRGLESFKLYNSTFAELTAEAVIDREGPAMPRNDRNTERVALADISGNMFVGANGEAFVHLCDVKNLIFKNNQFIKIAQPPLRLCPVTDEESTNTNRNWNLVFKNNGLPCNNCSDFSDANNNQVCSMYTSSHCTCSDAAASSCQEGVSLTKYVYDSCFVKTECQAKTVVPTASPSKSTNNDAQPLTRAPSLILVILIMLQMGLHLIYILDL